MIFVNNLCVLFRFCSIYNLKSDIDAGFCYLKHDIVFFELLYKVNADAGFSLSLYLNHV